MTIPYEKHKARLLGNSNVKAEYDALAAEYELSTEPQPGRRIRTRPGSTTEK